MLHLLTFTDSLCCSAPGSKISGRGTIHMSTCRIVFVLSKPLGNIFAFDMPLVRSSSFIPRPHTGKQGLNINVKMHHHS